MDKSTVTALMVLIQCFLMFVSETPVHVFRLSIQFHQCITTKYGFLVFTPSQDYLALAWNLLHVF